jgi:hypothetical protein
MEKEKGNIKGQFIFSPIFEKEEDCIDNPFVFEKFDLSDKTPKDYPECRKQGLLLRQKKSKKVMCQFLSFVNFEK